LKNLSIKKGRAFISLPIYFLSIICRQNLKLRASGEKQCRGIRKPKPSYPYLDIKVSKIEDKR